MAILSYPTSLSLPTTSLVPTTHPTVRRILNRLNRASLLSLALDWLSDVNLSTTGPYLIEPEDDESSDMYPAASSVEELRELYTQLGQRNGTKRDVLERILEGDWRAGISLYALAMADMQFIYSHPSSQKWTALKIVPLSPSAAVGMKSMIPRFHPATFLRNLHHTSLPDIKLHLNIDRHATLPLLILRIWVLESPYSTSRALDTNLGQISEASRTFYIAFPDFSPHIFITSARSLSDTAHSTAMKTDDSKSLRKYILQAIPKAFSRPRERYKLESTNFSASNLEALVQRRGNGRTNAAGGGWGIYAETQGTRALHDDPLSLQNLPALLETEGGGGIDEPARNQLRASKNEMLPSTKVRCLKRKSESDENSILNKRRLAIGRFGDSALPDDGLGIERLDILLKEPMRHILVTTDNIGSHVFKTNTKGYENQGQSPSSNADNTNVPEAEEEWRPGIKIKFSGTHVFAGLRELVECGIVDGLRMPGWMTGENGVSVGVVRDGRLL
ncbi:CHL4 family chromosome segregation protein [Blumeria hordei DH14]|uniref:CHL4 family chromosome segregation protein n=1 Tax=Blumeria graminis f. sp. hordei (strain DH14) TaxID=546991 RepID=N1JHN8_BLUG1|nr:CHL4 family chromosome segregation protein [Blumeria hordei DH14]